MPVVYILFSRKASKFYTGITTLSFKERLSNHLDRYYHNKYTSHAFDWEEFLTIECESIEQARSIETHIKKMKSSTYIRNLKKYPETAKKLLLKYQNS